MCFVFFEIFGTGLVFSKVLVIIEIITTMLRIYITTTLKTNFVLLKKSYIIFNALKFSILKLFQ